MAMFDRIRQVGKIITPSVPEKREIPTYKKDKPSKSAPVDVPGSGNKPFFTKRELGTWATSGKRFSDTRVTEDKRKGFEKRFFGGSFKHYSSFDLDKVERRIKELKTERYRVNNNKERKRLDNDLKLANSLKDRLKELNN